MFDEVVGMATLCTENFREGVCDTFGASIDTNVLDPILKELDSLRIFNTAFQQQSHNIDRILADVRLLQFKDSSWPQ